MSDDSATTSGPPDQLERLAAYLRDIGLATPTLMLVQLARPLGFIGGQALVLLQPFAPVQRWQTQIGRTALALEDDATWTRLEKLLQ